MKQAYKSVDFSSGCDKIDFRITFLMLYPENENIMEVKHGL